MSISKATYKKKSIPKPLRINVWETYIGNILYGKCFVCEREIKIDSFEAGHLVSEKDGGETCLSNLRPTCKSCNTSCGTKNMDDFRKLINKKPSLECTMLFIVGLPDRIDEYKVMTIEKHITNSVKNNIILLKNKFQKNYVVYSTFLFYDEEGTANTFIEDLLLERYRDHIIPSESHWLLGIDLNEISKAIMGFDGLLNFKTQQIIFDDFEKKIMNTYERSIEIEPFFVFTNDLENMARASYK
jgi:hypothetical protein